jgi:hypothetical protein
MGVFSIACYIEQVPLKRNRSEISAWQVKYNLPSLAQTDLCSSAVCPVVYRQGRSIRASILTSCCLYHYHFITGNKTLFKLLVENIDFKMVFLLCNTRSVTALQTYFIFV